MAKCVKMKDGQYAGKFVRIPNEYASKLVEQKRATYAPKYDWKRQEGGRIEPEGRV